MGGKQGWLKVPKAKVDLMNQSSIEFADGSGYLFGLDVFHQLHCLDFLRKKTVLYHPLYPVVEEDEDIPVAYHIVVLNHKLRYEAIPPPPLNADGGHGDSQNYSAAGNSTVVATLKRKVAISFLLGFTFASAIAAVLAFVVATNTQFQGAGRQDVQPAPSSSRFTFTPDWAGVVLSTPPSNQRFAAVKASLTIPHMAAGKESSGLAEAQAVSVWIGIDANSRVSPGLRTGLTLRGLPDGKTTLEAMYQWGSDGPHTYAKLSPLSPGEALQLEVVMFNETFAKAEMQNMATGSKATKYWAQPPQPQAALSGQSVGWILEDTSSHPGTDRTGKSSSLLDFGRLVLEHCIVWTDKDELLTADQGDVYRIRQGGVARTGVHVEEETVFFTFIE
ncbi:hypothetical protein Daus18300_002483 [Diaporthe australafricana]|uniref:Uncharacterized protein n=1 Tax=Diaporthe australafricana TaxID=127596 RepID=A0ABR3XP60_9PEZI